MNLGARHNPNVPPADGQRRRLAASGYGAPVAVTAICLLVLAFAYNHTRGNFHKLKSAVLPQSAVIAPVATGPGGQGAIELARSATSVGSYPQFISMTLLPGRGLDILQITANIPGHGDTPLLLSRSLDEASILLSDQVPAMQSGTTFGAALLAPWAGRMSGTSADNPSLLHSMWQGHWMAFPSEHRGSNRSVEGLLLGRASDVVKTNLLPSGESADATFHAGSFGDAWPSMLDVSTHVELTDQAVEITLTATNNGQAPTPVGLGWNPFFRIASGDRAHATLSIPSSQKVVLDPQTGFPSGKLDSVLGTPLDFSHAGGRSLGSDALDMSYSGLHRSAMADGPVIELHDGASGYGLRLVAISEGVSALHVTSPANQPWVALQAATNQSDPLGRQWLNTPEGSGIKILDPGQTLTLHLRLEIFAIRRSSTVSDPTP